MDKLSVYYQNVNGLRTKLLELQKAINTCIYDILILTETNLSPDVSDRELGLSDFSIFRTDRSHTTSSKQSGGGVLVATRTKLRANVIQSSVDNIESVFVSIPTHTNSFLICGTYIPPNQPPAVYERFCSSMDEVVASSSSFDRILVAGDFNLPGMNWTASEPIPVGCGSLHIIDMAAANDLIQLNRIPNARGVILDLMFCSDKSMNVLPALDLLLPEEAHHPALYVDISLPKLPQKEHTTSYDFGRCDKDKVSNKLHHLLGPVVFYLPDPITMFNNLLDTICSTVLEHTPVKKGGKPRYPCWFSPELKQLVIRKKIAHRDYKSNPTSSNYHSFKTLRSRCKELSSRCYANYVDHTNSTIPHNMKSFWSFVNNTNGSTKSTDSYYLNDVTEESPDDICNLFAKHFSSVFSTSAGTPPDYKFDTTLNLADCVLLEDDVRKRLASLDPYKGTGPDRIPPSVLKHCSDLLAPHLTVLFNALLKIGVFPDSLKTSFVVPIYKSGDVADVSNYRPIVIQPALGKVFESLVLDYIRFGCRSFLKPEQHGFTRGRSITTNLVLYDHYIRSSFQAGDQVDSVYLDFSKAFDVVSHQHLISKLQAYGFLGNLLSWFQSYLTNRMLIVKMSGAFSLPYFASSGVPQGSHLGPFLFSIFLNDIVDCIDVRCLIFADDMKVFTSVSSFEDCRQLQNCLLRIEDWCGGNCMKLNPNKCHIVSFNRSTRSVQFAYQLAGSDLERVETIRDLGIKMTVRLHYEDHIDSIANRASRMLGFLIRTSKCGLSVNAMKIVYTSLVRSILEFGSILWSPYLLGQIDRLQKIQDRFVRMVGVRMGFDYLQVPLHQVEELLGLDPLIKRRQLLDIMFLRRLLVGEVDCPALLNLIDFRVPAQTRSRDLFNRRTYSTNYELNSTIPRLHRIGNMISPHLDIFCDSSQRLKSTFLNL